MKFTPEVSERLLTICRYSVIVGAIFAPLATAVTSVALVLILITWLASGQAVITLSKSLQSPVGQAILLFYGWLIIGTLYADNSWSAKITTLLSWQKLLFVFLLLGLFEAKLWKQRFIYSFTIIMSIASLFSLVFWLLNFSPRAEEVGIVLTNHTSQSIAFVAALICCLFINQQLTIAKYQYGLWLTMVLLLINIFVVSPARTGYMIVPPALLVSGVCIYGYKKLPQILGVLLVLMALAWFGSSTIQERTKIALNEQASYQTSEQLTSIGTRMVFYTNTLELIMERPIFGYGTSSFGKTYSALVAQKYQDWRASSVTDPHNQYLFVLLENGLVGLVFFLFYIYRALRLGFTQPVYGQIAAGFLITICTSSLFNSHFKTFAEGNLLALFLGVLLAMPSRKLD